MKLLKLITLGLVLATTGILSANYYLEDAAFAGGRERYKTSSKCITREEIIKAQNTWGKAIVAIGKASQKGEDAAEELAKETIDDLYGYDKSEVLFKPTLASERQFRLNKKDALSYFVTGDIKEDKGFALKPWSNVRFENAAFSLNCQTALAMGNYYFTDAKTGKETKVEYSFGYIRNKDGKLLIILHDSSLPYNP